MPHETTWEAHGICQKFRETLSSPELLAALGEIQGDPRIKSLRYVIRDFRAVDCLKLAHAFAAGLTATGRHRGAVPSRRPGP